MLRDKNIIAAQQEHATALTFIVMFHSNACWKTTAMARNQFSKLTSKTAQKEAVKEQTQIRVIGFGWKYLHHPWSKSDKDYSPEHVRDYLIKSIIPEQKKCGIPDVPTVNLPLRGDQNQVGTKSLDVEDLQKKHKIERQAIQDGGEEMRDEMETDGKVDRYEQLQGPKPKLDENLIGA